MDTSVHVTNVDELLANIDLSNPRYREISAFWKASPNDWLFRGQLDFDEGLLPAALRRAPALQVVTNRGTRIGLRGDRTYKQQLEFEIEVLEQFYTLSNQRGLFLQPDYWSFSDTIDIHRSRLANDSPVIGWPDPKLWSLISTAQHHGIPTCFLDLTYNPFVAAYFAALSACMHGTGSSDASLTTIVIWAIHRRCFTELTREHKLTPIITPLAFGNENIVLQRGAMVGFYYDGGQLDDLVRRSGIEGFLGTRLIVDHTENAPMIRFTLPLMYGPELMRSLAIRGYSGSTLFSGYEGIAKGLQEQRYWPRSR